MFAAVIRENTAKDNEIVVTGGDDANPVTVEASGTVSNVTVESGSAIINFTNTSSRFSRAFLFVRRGAKATVTAPSSLRVIIEGSGEVTFKTSSADHNMRDYTTNRVQVFVEGSVFKS